LEKVSLLVLPDGEPTEEFINGIEENRENILEIISFQTLGVGERKLELPSSSKGEQRDLLLKEARGDLVLFISSASFLEEDFIEELLEAYENSSADIVFPNLILSFKGEDRVINYEDPFGREVSILVGLAIEEHVPEWGILAKKDKLLELGSFKKEMGDYEFYEFLYRNLKKLRLKLSELSYLRQEIRESFIDTSYRSYAVRNVALKNYDWKKELFPFLSWDENEEVALATAYTLIAERLEGYLDLFNASDYLRKALLKFHNQESLRRLLNVYRLMGLFEEVRRLLENGQMVSQEEKERELELTNQIEKAIEEIERAVESGKLDEALQAVMDFSQVYAGAPIYNILGVINWLAKEFEQAYRFFFKAVTMNPINQDYLYNLSQLAKELKREEEVKGLISRLVGNSYNE